MIESAGLDPAFDLFVLGLRHRLQDFPPREKTRGNRKRIVEAQQVRALQCPGKGVPGPV